MTSTVSQVLSEHHEWCDAAIRSIASEAARLDWQEVQAYAAKMRRALEWHMDAEETRLFPAFEAATGMMDGPTAVMRHEHGRIRELLGACHAAVQENDGGAVNEAIGHLQSLLAQHNMKEERILYPMCDRVLGPEARSLAAGLRSDIERLT